MKKYPPNLRGFTLIELLVVVAIVAVIAGILFPVLAAAKARSQQTVASSNMRQCFVAFSIYAGDELAIDALPTRDGALNLLSPEIIKDPADYWRTANPSYSFSTMVGSFGYANSPMCHDVETPSGLAPCFTTFTGVQFPWLISIFHFGDKLPPDEYVDPNPTFGIHSPSKVLALWPDGHVKPETVKLPAGNDYYFSWPTIFSGLGRATK